MTARCLYLHIGHGKTGTSFQQSCFALSGDVMRGHGIVYPTAPRADRAADGAVSSGNGAEMAESLSKPHTATRYAARHRGQMGHVFYSSEFLFHHLAAQRTPDNLLAFADNAGCDQVKILMLIRDPMDHMRSAYLQNVQRSGVTADIDEMAARFNMPMRANTLMKFYDHPRINITVRNYSRMKDRLIEETEAWLGLARGALLRPAQSRVNRSLTAAEMEMQRVFNGVFGASGALFADHVVEALPDLAADYPALSPHARQIAHERCERAMLRINRLIPPDQAYEFDLDPSDASEPVEDEFVTLTEAQINAIVAALAPKIRR